MEIFWNSVLETNTFLFLTGLIATSMYFAKVGIEDLKIQRYEGILFIALSVFFLAAQAIFIFSNGTDNSILSLSSQMNFFSWFTLLLAPAVISLYILFGLFSFVRLDFAVGIMKLVIGLALTVILYRVGVGWPEIIKAALAISCCFVWFSMEIRTADELR